VFFTIATNSVCPQAHLPRYVYRQASKTMVAGANTPRHVERSETSQINVPKSGISIFEMASSDVEKYSAIT
jgi:hypothetical protein